MHGHPGMPTWVKAGLAAAVAVAAIVLVLHLTGNGMGSHGP